MNWRGLRRREEAAVKSGCLRRGYCDGMKSIMNGSGLNDSVAGEVARFGKRTIAGRVVKESYGAAKQQHTFTEADKEKQKRETEEMGDAMKSLENRTLDSKREMDILAALG